MTSSRPPLLAVVLGVLAALGLLALSARPAAAHASLEQTVPTDGQTVAEAPEQVTWDFNEEVTSTSGALRVFDADGERIDTGQQTQLAPDQLAVDLREDVGPGSYVATYRVTSADGHLIRGAFLFEVGSGGSVDEDTLAALFGGGGDTVTSLAAGAVRAVGYAGGLSLGGALLWSVVVAGPGRPDERARGDAWTRRGAVLAAVAAALAIPVQAMLTSGLGLGALTTGAVLADTAASSLGVGAGLRLVAALAVLALLRSGRARPVAGVAAIGVLGSFLVDGHTRTVTPAWLMLLGDAIHLLAGAAWVGGLAVLAGVVRTRRREDDPIGAADVVARYSRVATWSLVAVTVAGLAISWALVREPRALVGTDYGWTLLAKVGLVAVVVLVGAYNNRRLVPAITRATTPAGAAVESSPDAPPNGTVADPDRRARVGTAAWRQLGRTVRFEIAVLVAVLGVTAFMVNLRPAAAEAGITGAFDTLVSIPNSELQLNLVVDPNRVGQNEIHFYVLDRTGRPVSDLQDVRVELTQPARDIGPLVREPEVAGPGHWTVTGGDLAVPGEWMIELVAGLDRFTEVRVGVPVVVNP